VRLADPRQIVARGSIKNEALDQDTD
jgi:hypothetical protein